MVRKPQHIVAIAALQFGLAFGATSCSATPVDPAETDATMVEEHPDIDPASIPAAPAGETSRRMVGPNGAVIHAAHDDYVAPPVVDGDLAAIQPLREEADRARAQFEFRRAEDLYRELRDHESTPRRMRSQFQRQLGDAADIAFGLKLLRKDLDKRDYKTASLRARRLAKQFPDVPFAALVDHRESSQLIAPIR